MSAQESGIAPDTHDVVVVGIGLAGVSTALAAALRGLRAVIVEREQRLQGASWWSGGQVWVPANHVQQRLGMHDSLEEGMTYVRGCSAEGLEYLDEEHMKRWLSVAPDAVRWFEEQGAARFGIIANYPDYEHGVVPGSRAEGRYLSAVFDARRLGPWRERLSEVEFFPVGTTYGDLLGASAPDAASASDGGVTAFGTSATARLATAEVATEDLLGMGAGVVAGFLHRALEAGVEIRMGHRVTAVLMDDGRCVGVRTSTDEGETVELHGPVVLATSGFDHDPELVREHLGLAEPASFAPPNIAGDGLRLARAAGADVVAMDPRFAPLYAGIGAPRGIVPVFEHSLPHAIVVDRHAQRFADDSLPWRMAHAAQAPGADHRPLYVVWDERHHQRYGLGATPPGGAYPDEVVSAPTLRELGERLGIDGSALHDTVARYNAAAGTGEDPDFGRGGAHFARVIGGDAEHPLHPNVAPLGSAGVGLSGIAIDADAHALDADGEIVPGLYAVGSAAAFTSSGVGYNSGWALSRAVTHGYLVGMLAGGRA